MVDANSINLGETGYASYAGAGVFHGRTFIAGTGVTIDNGDGTAGNTTITANPTTPFQPNAVLQEFDDFIESYNGDYTGKLQWYTGSTSRLRTKVGTTNNPGILAFLPNAGENIFLSIFSNNSASAKVGDIALGGGVTTVSWVIDLGTLSGGGNTYRFSCGLADAATIISNSDSFVDGVYFQYTDTVNGGQWQLKSTNTSVTTTVSTTVAAATGFNTFTVSVNAAGTSVSYYINNNFVGSAISTNIPTAALMPFMFSKNTAGTTPQWYVDLFWITINLSNPRPGPTSSTIIANYRFIGNYTQTGTNYQVLGTDAIVGISSTAAPRTITMPNSSVTTGQWWRIKDESGGAAANNITINGNGYLIDGAATYAITTNYGSVDIYFNGSAYYVS